MPNYAERQKHRMRLVELRFGSPVPDLRRWLVRFDLDGASLIRKALREDDQR